MKIEFNNKNWYCYLCGLKVGKNYFLFSMNDRTDRVFICCEECISQIPSIENNIMQRIEEI